MTNAQPFDFHRIREAMELHDRIAAYCIAEVTSTKEDGKTRCWAKTGTGKIVGSADDQSSAALIAGGYEDRMASVLAAITAITTKDILAAIGDRS